MGERIDPWLLWLRALLVGGLAFGFGIAGHVTADGLLPGPVVLVGLLVFTVLISLPMLQRPAGRVRLVALLVGGQTVVHLVLSVAAGHRGDLPRAAAPAHAGTLSLPTVDGHRVGSLQDAYQSMTGPQPLAPALPVGHLLADLSAHAPMMAVHLVAAALLGLWVARGERCLWTLLALTGRRLLAILPDPPTAATGVRRHLALFDDHPAPLADLRVRRHPRRGPPLFLGRPLPALPCGAARPAAAGPR